MCNHDSVMWVWHSCVVTMSSDGSSATNVCIKRSLLPRSKNNNNKCFPLFCVVLPRRLSREVEDMATNPPPGCRYERVVARPHGCACN